MHIFKGKFYVVFCFENLYDYDTIKLVYIAINSGLQSSYNIVKKNYIKAVLTVLFSHFAEKINS